MNDYDRPNDKDIYIAENGWHFNKKACDYAVQYLKGKDGKRIKPLSKEEVDAMLMKYGIKLEKNRGWDYVYAANMAKSDMEGSPLSDEKSQVMYVKILIDDPDAADGEIMACWYVKMLFRREPVDWGAFL
jgi:hypothetical protein